ncbi:MAG: DNA polymerase IV [Geobacter sp.]|nr:DNA polymerase IV [Geobacter sp.]
MERIIMHIDMNAFFASVEQQSNPALRGKPIAVTGSDSRTVILTASYEARAFGVKTGLTTWEARQKCPDLILVPTNNRLYTHVSSQIMKILHDYTPLVEVFSIDEAFMDITGSVSMFGSLERICYLIKSRISARFGITCSIGIAPNKLLAKLASEMKKPDGLTIIRNEDVSRTLEHMPIVELCGIGRKMAAKLALYSIRTCGELGRYPAERLKMRFGIVGEKLHQMGLGIDDSPVIPAEEAEEVKSVGHSMTLKRDIRERADILRYLLQLSEMVGRRARRYGVWGKTVHLTVRYADFTTFGKQGSQPHHINLSEEIYLAAVKILDSLELQHPVRLLGIRLTNLQHQTSQLPLFPEEQTRLKLTEAMDKVNNRHGDFTVMFASLLDQQEKGSHVISPAWRPEGIRNVAVA